MSGQRFSREWPKRLGAVIAGVAAAEAVWLLAELVFGVRLQAPAGNGYPQPMAIAPGTVGLAAGALSLLGWGVLALLERFTVRARAVWLVLSLLALAASFGLPLSGNGVPIVDRAALVLMHLTVAAIVIPTLYRTSRPHAHQTASSSAHGPLGEAA